MRICSYSVKKNEDANANLDFGLLVPYTGMLTHGAQPGKFYHPADGNAEG